jgi:putative transposase
LRVQKKGEKRFIERRIGVAYGRGMPRTARASVGGMWYHTLNRGNRREADLHKPGDFDAFVDAMTDVCAPVPVDLLGYCLMPNHFHLVLRPRHDGDRRRSMQWLLTAHARRYHRHSGTTGHVRAAVQNISS